MDSKGRWNHGYPSDRLALCGRLECEKHGMEQGENTAITLLLDPLKDPLAPLLDCPWDFLSHN